MHNLNLNQYISQRIRFFRLKLNLTQEELSEKAGLGINYINNIENKNLNIKLDTLEKIIYALDITFSEFFYFPDFIENEELVSIFNKLNSLPKNKRENFIKALDLLLK